MYAVVQTGRVWVSFELDCRPFCVCVRMERTRVSVRVGDNRLLYATALAAWGTALPRPAGPPRVVLKRAHAAHAAYRDARRPSRLVQKKICPAQNKRRSPFPPGRKQSSAAARLPPLPRLTLDPPDARPTNASLTTQFHHRRSYGHMARPRAFSLVHERGVRDVLDEVDGPRVNGLHERDGEEVCGEPRDERRLLQRRFRLGKRGVDHH